MLEICNSHRQTEMIDRRGMSSCQTWYNNTYNNVLTELHEIIRSHDLRNTDSFRIKYELITVFTLSLYLYVPVPHEIVFRIKYELITVFQHSLLIYIYICPPWNNHDKSPSISLALHSFTALFALFMEVIWFISCLTLWLQFDSSFLLY